MSFVYTISEFKKGLQSCGIKKGDTLFCHSNIGFFGFLKDSKNAQQTCETLLSAIFDVIGEDGTFVVPAFTYSFGNDKDQKIFDVQNSDIKPMGMFAEFIRNHQNSVRSKDPMFSVVAIGKKADFLTKDVSDECFGENSFWDRFAQSEGKICNFNFDSGSTLIHYFEKKLNVPYRKDLQFTGEIIDQGISEKKTVTYFCRDLNSSDSVASFETFDKYAKEKFTKTALVGKGMIVVISAHETWELIKNTISNEPFFLIKKGIS